MATVEFHWADYVLFSASLAVGLVIGVISMCTRGKEKTSSEYLLGGRNLNVFAVGASLLVSGLNAVFLLGGTAEVYYRGAIYGLMGLCFIPIIPVVVFINVPLWRQVELTTANTYLGKRYNSLLLRLWGGALISLSMIAFLAVVLYTPAMALSQVADISIHISIIVCGVVCLLYTVVGGLKAVVWTDCIQAIIMLLGLLVICIMGTVQVGGPTKMFHKANKIGRLNFNNFNPDPRERHSVWSVIIGYSITWGLPYLYKQELIQRIQSVKDVTSAQRSVVIAAVAFWMCLTLVVSVGLLASIYYIDCDPYVAGHITSPDQILPYFVMDFLGPYYGLPGLFISAIFAAALSTVSSSVNSLAAIFLEDFLKPFMAHVMKPIADEKEHIYAKVLSLVFGVLAIVLSYLAPLFGKAIIQIPPTITGSIGGPLFSMFFMGFFVRWSHKWGVFFGSIIGLTLTMWISIGAIVHGKAPPVLDVGMCLNNITTEKTTVFSTQLHIYNEAGQENSLQWLYDISYLWLGLIGSVCSIVAGMIISAVLNICGYRQDIINLDPNLLFHSQTVCGCRHDNKNMQTKNQDKTENLNGSVLYKDGLQHSGFNMEHDTYL